MSFEPASIDDLLDVFRREVSQPYAYGLENENDGFGFDIVHVYASQLARVAEAFALSSQAYYLRPHSTQVRPEAHGEARASLTISIERIGAVDFDLTLAAATGIEFALFDRDGSGASVEQQRYRLVSDVTFAAGDAGPTSVILEAVRPGYQANFPWPGVPGREFLFALRGTASVPGATFGASNDISDTAGVADRFASSMVGQFIRVVTGPNAGTYPRRIVSFVPPTVAGQPGMVTVDGAPLLPGVGDVEVEEFADVGFRITGLTPATGGRHGWLDAIGNERLIPRRSGETDDDYRARIAELPDVVSPAAIIRLLQRVLVPAGIPYDHREAGDPYTVTGFRWVPSNVGSGAMSYAVVNDYLPDFRRRFYVIVGLTGAGEIGVPYDQPYPDNAMDGGAFTDGYPVDWSAALVQLAAQLDAVKGGGIAPIIVIDPTL